MPGKPTVICHGDLAFMLVISIGWVVHCICMRTHCLHSSQRQFIKQSYKGQQMSINPTIHTQAVSDNCSVDIYISIYMHKVITIIIKQN